MWQRSYGRQGKTRRIKYFIKFQHKKAESIKMNREICIIERIHDGFYYLKSIKGMRYKVNGLKMKEYEKIEKRE